MALGDTNYNSNSNKMYESTYYSRLKVRNVKDNHVLGYSFKSGMIIVGISARKEDNGYETLAEIYITPTKAMILSKQIEKIKEEIATGKANTKGYGIITGLDETVSTLILRTIDTEVGVMPALTIGKIDPTGNFVKRVDFNFNVNYDFGINWSDVDGMKSSNEYFNDIEFDQFCRIINDFAASSNGAYAYSTIDMARYDYKALMNKLNPIYDKLGIERQQYGNRGNRSYSGNNFFNNNSDTSSIRSSSNKSYDELMNSIEDSGEEDIPFAED